MAIRLSESGWLSNKANALRILTWCVGNGYLANTFSASINRFVLGPVTAETTRRIRLMMTDQEQYAGFVPECLLSLVSTLPLGGGKQGSYGFT